MKILSPPKRNEAGLLLLPDLYFHFPFMCYAAQEDWCWYLLWSLALPWSSFRLCQVVSLSFEEVFSFPLLLSCYCSYYLWSLPDCRCFSLAIMSVAICCLSSNLLSSEQQPQTTGSFFSLFLSGLLSLTTSEDWMMASNSTPSTPIFSDYAFLAFHQVVGKKYFSGPVLPGKDPSLTVLILLSVPLFLLPTLFVLALFHLWYSQ